MKRIRPFTGTGDEGYTATARARVRKDSDLIEAIGSVDELVAHLGLARALAGDLDDVEGTLKAIQTTLFRYNASLLGIRGYEVTGHDVSWLEQETLRYDGALPVLSRFMLPGGSQIGAQLHVCRTTCRRAERRVVKLMGSKVSEGYFIPFLNRLSSLLFVMARYANQSKGAKEELV